MTSFTTQLDTTRASGGFFRRVAALMAAFIEARSVQISRRDQIEALQAMSDEELEATGLSRDQIAFYVYRDLFYA